jgi:hypothetical protein
MSGAIDYCRRLGVLLAVICAVTAALSVGAAPGDAAGRGKKPEVANCFWELARGRGSELVCVHPVWLADNERADLRRLTREWLQDARCTVQIRIARHLVMHALADPNYTFAAPPQPVACEISTRDKPVLIDATFAPRVVIKGGVAVDATPGLADVTGVNGYLAWPVVEYVNRSATVKGEMLKMINAYLSMRIAHPS